MSSQSSPTFTPPHLTWEDFKIDTEQPENLSEDDLLHIEQVAQLNLLGRSIYVYVPASGHISDRDAFIHLINNSLDWIQQHMDTIMEYIIEELFDDA